MKEFEDYLTFRSAGVVKTSLDTYRTTMAGFLDWCKEQHLDLKAIRCQHIQKWILEVRDDVKAATIKGKLSVMRSFFEWAVNERLIKVNPVDLKRLPKLRTAKPKKVPFTESDYERIVAVACQHGAGYWPDAIRIAWHTGLRMSDVAALSWSSVDLTCRQISLVARKKQQDDETLEIPIVDKLQDLLLRRWANRGDSLLVLPEFHSVFVHCRATCSVQFARLCERADLEGHSFHSLRHGFVSRLLNSGVDSEIIRSMTGQSAEVMHQYVHVQMETKRAALEAGQRKEQIA